MKLYDSRRAPNPRRVRWFMAEKGMDDVEIVDVDILQGEHRTPEFRRLAGMAQLPVLLLDDGTVLTESLAICRYLEALHPEPNLFGRDPKETAVVEMWTRRCELHLANPLMMAVRYGHPALAKLEGTDEAASAKQRDGAERMLKHLERQLEGREFIAADRITTADIVAVTGMDFARMIKWRPPETLVNVGRWYEAMRARPAAAAGM
ncbi:MAG: glutathione S-transferase N-terminal domain-containing protein [Proteobacteria bacterium]|nr:glutathione S-transferase N-terminal domain-containing protein [Pseudomonadota bacterium]